MMVGTQSAGIEKSLGGTGLVGAKETGEPPTSSGESGLSSQAGEHHLAPVESYPLELSWSIRTDGDWVVAKRGSEWREILQSLTG